jgi:hypothetical protein
MIMLLSFQYNKLHMIGPFGSMGSIRPMAMLLLLLSIW